MNLSLLVVLPLLSGIAILFCSSTRTIRAVAFTASILQIFAAAFLIYAYMQARAAGNTSAMLFEYTHAWFASLNIQYHTGVDGISIAMIALTALVVQAGILISWQQERMTKEFFFFTFFIKCGRLWIFYFSRPFYFILFS